MPTDGESKHKEESDKVYSCEQCSFSLNYIIKWDDLISNKCSTSDYTNRCITRAKVDDDDSDFNLIVKIVYKNRLNNNNEEKKDDEDSICSFCKVNMLDIGFRTICWICLLKRYFFGQCVVCEKLCCKECKINFMHRALCNSCRFV